MGGSQESRGQNAVVPLLLGMLGPRAITAPEAKQITRVVTETIGQLRAAYPHSDVITATSVAAGTDTEAAQAAHDIDCPVYALLPLEVDDYAQDFGEGELPLADRLDLTEGHWVSPGVAGSSRDARYQACGRMLARLSTTMLVAWNGQDPEKPGGTADTLHFAVPEVAALEDLSGGPSALTSERGDILVFPPDGSEELARIGPRLSRHPWQAGSDSVSQRIEEFNRDAGDATHDRGAILAIQEAADALASSLQARYRRWTTFLLFLGVLALVSVDVQAEIARAWFLGAQALTVITVLGMWWGLNRWAGKRKFEEYRALAEGARVQEAWQKAGVEACVADHYLQPMGEEGFWIRRALRTGWFLDLANRPAAIQDSNPVSAREWIEGQLRYFEGSNSKPGAIRRNSRKAKQMAWLAWVLAGLALAGLAPGAAEVMTSGSVDSAFVAGGRLAWGLGSASAAAVVAYSQLMGYSRAAKRGRLSLEMYRQALIDFDSVGSSQQAQRRIVLELGQEALRETGDWLVMNTSQSVRPV